jgi:hypothetical protein
MVDFSIALIAFANAFCYEVLLFPKRGLPESTNGFLLLSL